MNSWRQHGSLIRPPIFVSVSESGGVVARDAQEQAACIEETSGSLAEISATTMENATRAGEVDRLMQDARKTVQEAAQAMEGLTTRRIGQAFQ